MRKQDDAALSDLQKALELEPKNGSVYYDIAIIHGRNGNSQECIDAINKAFQYDSTNPKVYEFRARLQLVPVYSEPPFEIEPEQMEQYKLALADYNQAITLDPKDFSAHMGIVDAQWKEHPRELCDPPYRMGTGGHWLPRGTS